MRDVVLLVTSRKDSVVGKTRKSRMISTGLGTLEEPALGEPDLKKIIPLPEVRVAARSSTLVESVYIPCGVTLTLLLALRLLRTRDVLRIGYSSVGLTRVISNILHLVSVFR